MESNVICYIIIILLLLGITYYFTDEFLKKNNQCSRNYYGYCPDGITKKIDLLGTNCFKKKKKKKDNLTCPLPSNLECQLTQFGCCQDGKTKRMNKDGTNCFNNNSNISYETRIKLQQSNNNAMKDIQDKLDKINHIKYDNVKIVSGYFDNLSQNLQDICL